MSASDRPTPNHTRSDERRLLLARVAASDRATGIANAAHLADRYTLTVTLCRRDDGEPVSHHVGSPRGRLHALRALLDKYPAEQYRVTAISTPESILRDMDGARSITEGYEPAMLGRIGAMAWWRT